MSKQLTTQYSQSKFPFDRFEEHSRYTTALHQASIFPSSNIHQQATVNSAVISFRFRSVEFSKKRVLPFFIALELLTHQKCVASLSKRNVLSWKIRKGRLVGCKVTLRNSALFDFFDTLSLTLPRREKFQPANRSKEFKKLYGAFSNQETTKFAIAPTAKLNPSKNSSFGLTLSELVLFYPIEVGLGLHPDVQRVQVRFNFSSRSLEERFFLLRSAQLPVV